MTFGEGVFILRYNNARLRPKDDDKSGSWLDGLQRRWLAHVQGNGHYDDTVSEISASRGSRRRALMGIGTNMIGTLCPAIMIEMKA